MKIRIQGTRNKRKQPSPIILPIHTTFERTYEALPEHLPTFA